MEDMKITRSLVYLGFRTMRSMWKWSSNQGTKSRFFNPTGRNFPLCHTLLITPCVHARSCLKVRSMWKPVCACVCVCVCVKVLSMWKLLIIRSTFPPHICA